MLHCSRFHFEDFSTHPFWLSCKLIILCGAAAIVQMIHNRKVLPASRPSVVASHHVVGEKTLIAVRRQLTGIGCPSCCEKKTDKNTYSCAVTCSGLDCDEMPTLSVLPVSVPLISRISNNSTAITGKLNHANATALNTLQLESESSTAGKITLS